MGDELDRIADEIEAAWYRGPRLRDWKNKKKVTDDEGTQPDSPSGEDE